jgi:pimeloyl-ACP methyl ester carboxylesterase
MSVAAAPSTSPSSGRVEHERVGNYLLVRRIGVGGMAEVWLGRHAVSGTLGAVKRLSPKVVHREHVSRYFAREGKAIARLAHPHVVPLFEFGDGYVVTQFVDGMNLARRMQSPMDPVTAVRITRQIAAALVHAHGRGIVHRDVKPENILLDAAGDAFLGDFGVAALGDEHAGEIVGTPQFMAPEQRIGRPTGPAADQYALARTLLEMLCGVRVPIERLLALSELPRHLPEALAKLLDRATSVDPADRFPSVAAFDEALAAIDLSAYEPEVRRGVERRPAWPFRWLEGACAQEALGADLVRAEYKLRDLVARQLIDARAAELLLERSGLADVGFSVWGATARLGELTQANALARAAEVVVLLHGLNCDRDVWRIIAPSLCRGSSLRIVIAPDVHGFGDSKFSAPPSIEQGSMQAIARTAMALTRLLGIRQMPTALVGHSMSGIGLLSLEDFDYDPDVVRVAVNPILVSHDPTLRPKLRRWARAARALARVPWLFRLAGRLAARTDKTARGITREAFDRMVALNQSVEPAVLARVISAFAEAPLRIGRQQGVALIACIDDPWTQDEQALVTAAEDLGLERSQIQRMPTGSHFPFLESATHPEWTARNVDQLVRVIESMLVTANASTDAPRKRAGGLSMTDTAPASG